jgi:hypothetical protein
MSGAHALITVKKMPPCVEYSVCCNIWQVWRVWQARIQGAGQACIQGAGQARIRPYPGPGGTISMQQDLVAIYLVISKGQLGPNYSGPVTTGLRLL